MRQQRSANSSKRLASPDDSAMLDRKGRMQMPQGAQWMMAKQDSAQHAELGARRLAAVMFVDLVGYSALMQTSETAAQQAVDRLWTIARPLIKEHGGEEIRLFGDGMLLTFPGTLAAAHCGLATFDQLAQLNQTLAEQPPIRARIGLHLGEIGSRDGEIFGDGVNIAARLVDLAPPGGIALSPHVREQLANTLNHPLQSLGEKSLKNIQNPLEVFCLPGPECQAGDLAKASLADRHAARRWRFGLASFDEQTQDMRIGGNPLELDPRSAKVLQTLLHHAGEVVSREELREAAGEISDSSLSRAIERLRKALRHTKQSPIKTHPGQGYRLAGPVSLEASEPARITQFDFRPGDRPPLRPLWQLEKMLGQGGQGEVWQAKHSKTGEKRVYKFALDDNRLSALKREITLSRMLHSAPHSEAFIRVLDWNLDRPPYFLESEFGGSKNLADWAASQGGIQQIPLATRLDLIIQIAEALATAHSVGVLHKDLKPANVLIQPGNSEKPQIKLTDFGSGGVLDTGMLDDAGITQMGFTRSLMVDGNSTIGTPMYFAPEVLAGQIATVQADLYALGVMLYQMVAGNLRKPLATGWEAEVKNELLREDIAAATQGDPNKRLSSAGELAERLRKLYERGVRLNQQRAEHEEAARAKQAAAEAEQQMQQFRSRRRWGLALLLTLSAALLITLQQQRELRTAQQAAQQQAEQARWAQQLAEQSATEAQAVADFLSRDLFAQVNEKPLATLTVPELLMNAARTLDARENQIPQVSAQLHYSVGEALLKAQRVNEAGSQFSAALAAYESAGLSGSPAAVRLAANLLKTEFGAEPQKLRQVLPRYYSIAAAAQARLGPHDNSVTHLKMVLARAQYALGEWIEASNQLHELVLALDQDATQPELAAMSRIHLGEILLRLGRFAEAASLFRQAQAIREDGSIGIAAHLFIARMLIEQEQLLQAQQHLEQAQKLISTWNVPGGVAQLSLDLSLGLLLLRQQKAAAARSTLETALTQVASFGHAETHSESAEFRSWLSQAYAQEERWTEAIQTAEQAMRIDADWRNKTDPKRQMSQINLVEILLASGRAEEATAVWRQIERNAVASLGDTTPLLARLYRIDGLLAQQHGDTHLAHQNLDTALRLYRALYDEGHSYVQRAQTELAKASQKLGQNSR